MSPSGNTKRRRRAWLATAFVFCAFGGATACNAILDNEERTLRKDGGVAGEGGTSLEEGGGGTEAGADVKIPGDGGCSPDILTDGKNCGACGFECGVGECKGGVCQPIGLGPPSNSPSQIFVRQGRAYFTHSNGGGASWCLVDDCKVPTQFQPAGQPIPEFGLAVNEGQVALIAGADIRIWKTLTPAAGTSDLVANVGTLPRGIALPEPATSTVLYFSTNAGEMFFSGSFPSSTPSRIGIGAANGGSVSTDNMYVYWGSNTNMQQVPVTASNMTATGASNGRKPVTVLVVGNRLYWTGTGGPYLGEVSYRTMPGTGGALAATSEQFFATGQGQPYGITVDKTHVYWTIAGGTLAGQVRRCVLGPQGEGCKAGTALETIATGQLEPRGIAVDADYVYWANHGGSLMKMRKPR